MSNSKYHSCKQPNAAKHDAWCCSSECAPTSDSKYSNDFTDKEFADIKSSFVLKVLKNRIYYGKSHATSLEDLKKASKEILDWCDDVIESGIAAARTNTLKAAIEALPEPIITLDTNPIGLDRAHTIPVGEFIRLNQAKANLTALIEEK